MSFKSFSSMPTASYMGTVPIMAVDILTSLRRKSRVLPKLDKSMIASAFMSMAFWTFGSSSSWLLCSGETPRLTLIFVRQSWPTASGDRLVWTLLAGMATFPLATRAMSFSTGMCSFSATIFICGVTMPLRAASICVVIHYKHPSYIKIILNNKKSSPGPPQVSL